MLTKLEYHIVIYFRDPGFVGHNTILKQALLSNTIYATNMVLETPVFVFALDMIINETIDYFVVTKMRQKSDFYINRSVIMLRQLAYHVSAHPVKYIVCNQPYNCLISKWDWNSTAVMMPIFSSQVAL